MNKTNKHSSHKTKQTISPGFMPPQDCEATGSGEAQSVRQRRTLAFRCPSRALFDAYLAHELPAFEMSSIKFHIMACSACNKQRKAVLDQLSAAPAKSVAASIPPLEPAVTSQLSENLPEVFSTPTISSDSRPKGDNWGELSLTLKAADSPGLLADCTLPYAGHDLYVTNLFFSVSDDNSNCALDLRAQGDWDKISRFKATHDHTQLLRIPSTKVLANPYIFAFAVQMDEDKGLAARVAEIVCRRRVVDDWLDADSSLYPCGAIVSLVGKSVELPAAEAPIQQFFMQGLIAAHERSVQEDIIRDLYEFFQRERALKWLLGSFGRPQLPTRFRVLTSASVLDNQELQIRL